jgi:DNA modification methylase
MRLFHREPRLDLWQGDALQGFAELEDESVQCVVTSPPYWQLRDYGEAGQLGLEASPEEYVAHLVQVMREVRRVLRKDGIAWLNVGDTYVGGRNGGVGRSSLTSLRNHHAAREAWLRAREQGTHRRPAGLKPKDLVLIPFRVALALQADGWWVRSDVVWSKPNVMPESVRDRPTKAHEYLFLLTKSERYFWDRKALEERTTGRAHSRGRGVNPKAAKPGKNEETGIARYVGFNERWRVKQNASFSGAVRDVVRTRNARSVWSIPTQPFRGAHFATFPRRLAQRCILAGSRAGDLVFDPFVGAGTAALVALQEGRRFVGVDLSDKYLALARERLALVQLALPGVRGAA